MENDTIDITLTDPTILKDNNITQLVLPHSPVVPIDESKVHTQFQWKIDLDLDLTGDDEDDEGEKEKDKEKDKEKEKKKEKEKDKESSEKAQEVHNLWKILIALLKEQKQEWTQQQQQFINNIFTINE